MLIRRTTQLALAALVALVAACAGATGAHAATTCKFANNVVEVHITQHRERASFAVANGTIGIGGETTTPVTCSGGTPTTSNTDTILIVDDSDNLATPAGNDGNSTVYITEPKVFGPGKTDEPFSEDEIEFLVDTKGGNDLFVAGGFDGQDIFVGNDGVNWTFDLDADLIGMPFDEVALNGSFSNRDVLSGQGGRGTGAPLSTADRFRVDANGGNDYIQGSDIPAGDSIDADEGNDTIEAGAGDDLVSGWTGDDTIKGGPGNDTVSYDRGAAQAATVDLGQTGAQDTGAGTDTLSELENVRGSMGPDRLIGTSGANVLDGGDGGDDTLEGRGGADDLRGGPGNDAASYAQAPAGVTVDLARTNQQGGEQYSSIEDVIGSPLADTLTGNTVANRIVGGAGTDTVAAGAGADRVEVRDGEGDRVSCGADADTAISDRRAVDAVDADCETVDALPEPAEPNQPNDPTTPDPTTTPDTTLNFSLSGASRQRVLRQKAVRLKVSSPDEASTIVATGSASLRAVRSSRLAATRLRLGPLTTTVAAASPRTVNLRLTRKQLGSLRKAIAAGQRPTVSVAVEARDAAGNTVRRTLRVRVKR